jgi:hypothetical protein
MVRLVPKPPLWALVLWESSCNGLKGSGALRRQ